MPDNEKRAKYRFAAWAATGLVTLLALRLLAIWLKAPSPMVFPSWALAVLAVLAILYEISRIAGEPARKVAGLGHVPARIQPRRGELPPIVVGQDEERHDRYAAQRVRAEGAGYLAARWRSPELIAAIDAAGGRSEIEIIVDTEEPYDFAVIDLLLGALSEDIVALAGPDAMVLLYQVAPGSWSIRAVVNRAGIVIAATALGYQISDYYRSRSMSMDRSLAAICYVAASHPDTAAEIRTECDRAMAIDHVKATELIDRSEAVPRLPANDRERAVQLDGDRLPRVVGDIPAIHFRGVIADDLPCSILAPDIQPDPIPLIDLRNPPARYVPGAEYAISAILRYDARDRVTGAMVRDARPLAP